MKVETINIKEIYVPKKHLEGFTPTKVIELAEAMMEGEDIKPIKIREGKGRYVLIEGVHRLQACKEVGETEINAYIVGVQVY